VSDQTMEVNIGKEFDDYFSCHGIRREKTILGTPN
jgi:hypothetical protein